MTAYQHGGDIAAFAQQCNCKAEEVIDLSSNINFVKPNIDIDFNELNITPYPNYDSLYHNIAHHYHVDRDELELFNGGSVAIFSLFRMLRSHEFGLHQCCIYAPAYLEYKKAADRFGYERINIYRDSDIKSNVPEESLVVFVNPSTPDGVHYDLEDLLKRWQKKRCTILIDESFIEFVNKPSLSSHIQNYDKLYLLKSMTKYFGAAGIRVGALLSNSNNISKLMEQEALWKISTFDATYIEAVLRDRSFKGRSTAANLESKKYLIQILNNSNHIKQIYPSDTNFILVELHNMKAKEFQELLVPHKIMVRSCENFDGLGEYHVRIAVKSMEDLTLFKKGLEWN